MGPLLMNFWRAFTVLLFLVHASEGAFLLTRSSIHPPFGNSLFLRLNASGVQIYRCDKSMEYNLMGATAKLFSSHDNGNGSDNYRPVGYHYYLSHLIAQGGQPTFSLSMVEGDPISAIPESTVTVNELGKKKKAHGIDDLLLKAVSHSGHGRASRVSYVQRKHSKGRIPPSSSCNEIGKQIRVPYAGEYLFWSQDRSLPPDGIPSEISVDARNFSLLLSFYSEGYQHYRFNGSSWINFNVSALLYTSPGQEIVGRHYFLEEADTNGGQLAWDLFMPQALSKVRVILKVVSTTTVDEDSIDWSKLEVTSYGGNPHDISRSYLGQVKYIQRVSTVGGLPPQDEHKSQAKAGDTYFSPFSTIYYFYSDSISVQQ